MRKQNMKSSAPRLGEVLRQLSVQQRQDVAQRVQLPQDALGARLQKVVPLQPGREGAGGAGRR